MALFNIPEIKDMDLGQLKEIGKSLNARREEVLSEYKNVADKVQKAITKAEKNALENRKANDANYDKKAQTIGRK